MRLQRKNILSLSLMFILFAFASCGKKTNTVNSSGYGSSPFYSGNPALTSNPSIVNQVQSVRSSVTCLPGRYRLTNDVTFYISGGAVSGTTIGGNWQPGMLTNGQITDLFVGVSAYRDLMFVTKVTNGSQVVGYNVTLSYCQVPNAYQGYPDLVSNDRPLANFQAQYGINLDKDTYCGYGVVDAAINTVIVSQRSSSNPYTSDFPVYTSFTKPICNGKF